MCINFFLFSTRTANTPQRTCCSAPPWTTLSSPKMGARSCIPRYRGAPYWPIGKKTRGFGGGRTHQRVPPWFSGAWRVATRRNCLHFGFCCSFWLPSFLFLRGRDEEKAKCPRTFCRWPPNNIWTKWTTNGRRIDAEFNSTSTRHHSNTLHCRAQDHW